MREKFATRLDRLITLHISLRQKFPLDIHQNPGIPEILESLNPRRIELADFHEAENRRRLIMAQYREAAALKSFRGSATPSRESSVHEAKPSPLKLVDAERVSVYGSAKSLDAREEEIVKDEEDLVEVPLC